MQGSCNRSDESRGYSPTFAVGREQKGHLYSDKALLRDVFRAPRILLAAVAWLSPVARLAAGARGPAAAGALPVAPAGVPDPQPAAHAPHPDLLGHGESLRGAHLQRSLQVLLPLQGPRLHHPCGRRPRHLRAHLRHRRRVRSRGRRRGHLQDVHHPSQEREAAGSGGGDHSPGPWHQARDVVRPRHQLLRCPWSVAAAGVGSAQLAAGPG